MTNTYMWVVKMCSKMHLFIFSVLIINFFLYLSNLECVQLCSIISSQNICNIPSYLYTILEYILKIHPSRSSNNEILHCQVQDYQQGEQDCHMYQEHSNKCSGVKNSQRDPPGLHTLWAITENLITIAVVSHDLLDSHDNHGKRINIFKASVT